MLKNIYLKIFLWLGKKLYKHTGDFGGKDMILFSNYDDWSHRYGFSKREMGLETPKMPK